MELADGRWAAFEFKVGEDKVEAAEESLLRLRRKLCENPRARVREPEFLAVVTRGLAVRPPDAQGGCTCSRSAASPRSLRLAPNRRPTPFRTGTR